MKPRCFFTPLAAIASSLILWLAITGEASVPVNKPRIPGAVNHAVTQQTIYVTVCVPGYSSRIRPPVAYTSALKREQIRELGLPGTSADYQEDHLLSLSLGGHPTSPRNLWPEAWPAAHRSDRLEARLWRDVCAGRRSLRNAQWIEKRWKLKRG